MELKAGYKQTEVGVIPEDWEVATLGNLSQILRGGSPRPIEMYLTRNRDGYNWIKIGDVAPNAKYIFATEEKIINEGMERSRFVHEGDLLLSNSMSFGRPYILQIDGCIHDGWLVIQNYKDTFDTNFLYYLLCSEQTLKQYKAKAAGSGVLNLNKELVASVLLGYPSKPEQKAIASALSDVDALLSSLDALIAKKRDIKTAAMQELLTGKTRLPGFSGKYKQTEVGNIPEDWDVAALGEVAQILRGGSPRPIEAYLTKNEGGYNWIKIGDVAPDAKYIYVTEERIIKDGATRSRRVYRGDLLLSNSMSFGRPYILQLDGCIHDGWLVIQNYQKKFDTDFLYYLLSSEVILKQYRAKAAGSGVLNLNKELVVSVILYSPPKTEQASIAAVLSDMDAEITALETRRAKVQSLKQGMMQELLTGRTRLLPEGEQHG